MMPSTKKAAAKRSRASAEQLRVMADVLAETEGLASGKFQRLHGKLEHEKKWRELAAKLNAVGGALKTVEQWNIVWRGLKRRTSNRVRDINNQKAQTGNRPISIAPLTDMELRIVDMIGDSYVEGAGICDDSVTREQESQELLEQSQELLDEDDILWPNYEEDADVDIEIIPVTPRPTATPIATATPRPGLKRKRTKEQCDNDRAKFLEIADKQADTLRILAENQAKQADATLAMANAVNTMGEGLQALAGALNRLSQAINKN